jgi:hypothetical protein
MSTRTSPVYKTYTNGDGSTYFTVTETALSESEHGLRHISKEQRRRNREEIEECLKNIRARS